MHSKGSEWERNTLEVEGKTEISPHLKLRYDFPANL
jgi:hypothetical protein